MVRRRGVVLALVLLAAAYEPGAFESEPSSAAPPSPARVVDPWSGYGPGWSVLPAPPEQLSGDTWIWTGSEVLVAGGCDADVEDECRETRRAFAFDPVTRSWHRVRSALEPLAGAVALWTGEEAIFLETYGGEPGPIVGQAYDPVANEWRRIARAPLSRGYGGVRVWTGEELLVWGGGDRGDNRSLLGATYDPAADSWSPIAEAPIGLNLASGVWTGSEVLVFGSLLSGANRAPTPTSVGAAYDPAADAWRELPPSALSPQATSAVWLDGRLVAWDYEVHSQEYDPAENRWSAPVRMPLSFSECYPDSAVVSGYLFAWFCGDAALYDGEVGGWEGVEGGPLDETLYSDAYKRDVEVWRFADLVPAGPMLVMPMQGLTLNRRGIACYGCEGSPISYWLYRPPDEVVPDSIDNEPGKGAVHRAVSDFFYAWLFDVEGRLPWLATPTGLARFEERVPKRWSRTTYRIDRVEALGGGFFETTLRLIIRDEQHRGPDAIARPMSLVFGPGMSIGGEPMPLLLTDVRR